MTGSCPHLPRRIAGLPQFFQVGLVAQGVHRLPVGLVFERHQLASSQIHELAIQRANLDWRGFSHLASRSPGHPATPDYDRVSAQPPWRTTLEGWCTRYGDVRELIVREDGKLVVLNGGDALTISGSAAALPSAPNAMVRTFFLYSVGWNREDNANTVGGDRVEPLPGDANMNSAAAQDGADDWCVQYNTRWVPRNRFDLRYQLKRDSLAH